MANEFYALMGRMRYITRWGLMRNTFSENIQEHSHQVAVLAHALALIRKTFSAITDQRKKNELLSITSTVLDQLSSISAPSPC